MNKFVWKNGTGKNPVPLTLDSARRLASVIKDTSLLKEISGYVGFIEEVCHSDKAEIEKFLTIVEMYDDLEESFVQYTIGTDGSRGTITFNEGTSVINLKNPTNGSLGISYRNGIINIQNYSHEYSTTELEFITFTMVNGVHYCNVSIPLNLSQLGYDDYLNDFTKHPHISLKIKSCIDLWGDIKNNKNIVLLCCNAGFFESIIFAIIIKNYFFYEFDSLTFDTIYSYIIDHPQKLKEFLREPNLFFTVPGLNYKLGLFNVNTHTTSEINVNNTNDYSKIDQLFVFNNNATKQIKFDYFYYLSEVSRLLKLTNGDANSFLSEVKKTKTYENRVAAAVIELTKSEFDNNTHAECHAFYNDIIKYLDQLCSILDSYEVGSLSRRFTVYQPIPRRRIIEVADLMIETKEYDTTPIENSSYLNNRDNTLLNKLSLPATQKIKQSGTDYSTWIYACPNLEYVSLPNVTIYQQETYSVETGFISYCDNLKSAIFKLLNYILVFVDGMRWNIAFVTHCPALEALVFGTLNIQGSLSYLSWYDHGEDLFIDSNSPRLMHLELGKNTYVRRLSMGKWNPTEAMSKTSRSMIMQDYIDTWLNNYDLNYRYVESDFASNYELWILMFKLFIADRLKSDVSDCYVKFSRNVYNAITNDTVYNCKQIMQLKGWIVESV